MITSAPLVVVLSLYSLLHPVAFTGRGADCRALPQNIQIERDLRPAVAQLLARSRTLRSQCRRIAASPATHVSITISLSPMTAGARARSFARRYESGLLVVEVQLPPASSDFAELLAHELEHVTELIDGVNFRALADAGTRGIARTPSDGSFESDRARNAGIAAATEAAAGTDGAAGAVCSFGRGWRVVARFARVVTRR